MPTPPLQTPTRLPRNWSASRYSAFGPPPPPRPAGPPLFLFEIHADPIFDHPLWSDFTNTIPSLRVEVRCQYDQDGVNTWAPAAGPADTVYAHMTLLARLMDGFARRAPRRPFRWFGVPAGFGGADAMEKYPNAIPLLNNPVDRLASGRRGPFIAEGVRRNAAWSAEFFEHLAAELALRKLPDPLAFIITSERGLADDYGGHDDGPIDHGWVPEALADPRAHDPAHSIDGRRTFAQYMADSRTLTGEPVPPHRKDLRWGMPLARSPFNDESTEQFRGAIRLAWDWSREQAFSRFARAAFARDPANPARTVRIGEYEANCDSPWAPVHARPGTLLHQMNGLYHSDLQCPEWYGGMPLLLTEPIFDADSPGWGTMNNWLRVFPNGETDPTRRRRRLALDIQKSIAQSCAASAPSSPLAPFVSNGPEAFEDDMVEYLRHCRTHGAWAACVFMPKPDRAAHDYWYRVVRRVCA